jgi:ABC-type multidrug transport system fused ATPase/permease subunit
MPLFKKAWLLLSHDQKMYVIFIFIMMFIAMILESISVGIAIPLISILLKGEVDTSFFSYLFTFGRPTGENLIYIGLSITFLVFLIKNLALMFNLWHQKKFLRKITIEFTSRLFKHYLRSDYIFFLQKNSAHLYRNLTDIIGTFVDYINRYMVLLSEIIVFIGIIFILCYVNFLTTIIVLFSIGVVSFLIYILTIKKITFFGKERNVIGGELNKHLFQGMASAKDVKILDREDDLIYQVDKNLFKMTKINHLMQFINGIPRLLFEVLIVCVFVTLVFLLLGTKKDMIEIIQYLGIFAIASFRIIPGATRIFSSYQMISYDEPAIKILLQEFSLKDNSYEKKNYQLNDCDTSLTFQKEINLKNLSF